MRFILILAASSSLAYLFARLLHFQVPLSLKLYVGWLFLCASLAYFVLQLIPQTEKSYADFFVTTMTPACLLALLIAVNFAVPLGKHGFRLFIFGALFFASLVRLFRDYIPNSRQSDIMLTQGYVLCLAGIFTIASLVPLQTALGFRLRVALGLYWLSVGAYSFCISLGVVRSQALWESIDGWFASAACVVFLGGLGIALSGAQPESARQHVTDEVIADLQWEGAE